MTSHYVGFKSPPVTHKANGNPRMVGFELEFSGLTLEQTFDALQSALGGTLQQESAAEKELYVDSLGTFNIELDWSYLKRKAAEDKQEEKGEEWINLLSQASTELIPTIPMEIACPPIPITHLDRLEPMVIALREAGAVGTKDSLLAAYGVHINTEIVSLDAETIFCYLRAFALLQWWLLESHEVDATRKISPYVDLYPEAYLKQLLSRTKPTTDQLFIDYLKHNATRNRALDLLPLLAEIDGERVRSAVDDPKIKARPAFHYRLANCQIEKADWSLATAWNYWWVVEQLAHRPDNLNELSTAFLNAERPIIGVSRSDWLEFIEQWLKDHELA